MVPATSNLFTFFPAATAIIIASAAAVVPSYMEALEDQPELVNQDAYENWIIKVELSDKSDLDKLMDAAAYEKFCQK